MELVVSNIAYAPYAFLGSCLVARHAKRVGYTGQQLAPCRGLFWPYTPAAVNRILPVVLVEGPWGDDPTVKRYDPLGRIFFANPKQAEKRLAAIRLLPSQPRLIAHRFEQAEGLVEISPGLFAESNQIAVRAMAHGQRLVSDLYHWRRDFYWPHEQGEKPLYLPNKPILDNWRTGIKNVASLVDWVHFQPMRGTSELFDWLAGRPTELEEMLDVHLSHCQHLKGIVVEASIGIPTKATSKAEWLRQMAFWLPTMGKIARKLKNVTEGFSV